MSTPNKAKHGNQGTGAGVWIELVTYGVGMLVGAQIAGLRIRQFLRKMRLRSPLLQWQSFWWIPALFAAAVLLLFIALFREKEKNQR